MIVQSTFIWANYLLPNSPYCMIYLWWENERENWSWSLSTHWQLMPEFQIWHKLLTEKIQFEQIVGQLTILSCIFLSSSSSSSCHLSGEDLLFWDHKVLRSFWIFEVILRNFVVSINCKLLIILQSSGWGSLLEKTTPLIHRDHYNKYILAHILITLISYMYQFCLPGLFNQL